MPGASFQSRWLPAIAWACLMFALSGVPSLGTDLGVWDTVLRKLAHAAEYAILAMLLTRAVAPRVAFLGAVAFAVTDELHQALVPGRAARPLDVAIDAAGALVGLLVLRRLSR
jgi:VanZ family protein